MRLLFGLHHHHLPSRPPITAHPSSPMFDPHSKPNTNQSTGFRVTPTAARVPTCSTAHSSIGLRHPRGRPFVNHATLHSKLAALPACTGHACEGSKWSRETHLTTRMRWRSKELKWEGQKWMDGQTRTVGISSSLSNNFVPITTLTKYHFQCTQEDQST